MLVAHNENDDPRTFAVAEGGASFEYTLPGGALATFVWRGLSGGARLLPAPSSATFSGGDAAAAVDDDASTRWTTGAGQQPGQTLLVDLGRTRTARQLVLDTGPDVGDYPRGYVLTTSRDGVRWSAPVTGAGSGQLTTIPLPHGAFRYARIVQTGTSGSWWSVADLRVYA